MSLLLVNQILVTKEREILDKTEEFIDQLTSLNALKNLPGSTPAELRVNQFIMKFSLQKQSAILTEAKEEFRQLCVTELGMKSITLIPDKLSDQDLNTLGLDLTSRWMLPMINGLHPHQMTCYERSLLDVNEPGVQELFFISDNKELVLIKDESFLWLIDKLNAWGYEMVADPEPNDLVLYLQDGKPRHMGRYVNEGYVCSKPGNNSHYYYHHPINLVWSNYGNEIAFYRKKVAGIYNACTCTASTDLFGMEINFTFKRQITPLR